MQANGTSRNKLARTEEALIELKKSKKQFLEQKQSLNKLLSHEVSVLKEINDYSSGSVVSRNAQLKLEDALDKQAAIEKQLNHTMTTISKAEKDAEQAIAHLKSEIAKENQMKEDKDK